MYAGAIAFEIRCLFVLANPSERVELAALGRQRAVVALGHDRRRRLAPRVHASAVTVRSFTSTSSSVKNVRSHAAAVPRRAHGNGSAWRRFYALEDCERAARAADDQVRARRPRASFAKARR